MPKRNRKKYSRPRKAFDKTRIEEENVLKEKYGLKNKLEIWKADAKIARIRNLAKELITKPEEEKTLFIERLNKKGFDVQKISDALSLNKEDWLKRRLQTIVFSKGLANTPKQARQFITHKHIQVGERIVNIPSYQVSLEEEGTITINITFNPKEDKKSKVEEVMEEVTQEELGEDENIKELEEEIAN